MTGPRDQHFEPCGADCAFAERLARDPHGPWLWCDHPARRALVRDEAKCARFQPQMAALPRPVASNCTSGS